MAKKKDLSLEEINRSVELYKDYHSVGRVLVEDIAKELGVKKLDLWEYISSNQRHFILSYRKNRDTNKIHFRFINKVLKEPMSHDEYNNMIRENDYAE